MGWVIMHSEGGVVSILGGLPNGGAIRNEIGGL
jgi:hypothetical protein